MELSYNEKLLLFPYIILLGIPVWLSMDIHNPKMRFESAQMDPYMDP
jgi:hypothetical protein